MLDAGSGTSDPNVSNSRGHRCTYYFFLKVWDKTRLNDDSGMHHNCSICPFCHASSG